MKKLQPCKFFSLLLTVFIETVFTSLSRLSFLTLQLQDMLHFDFFSFPLCLCISGNACLITPQPYSSCGVGLQACNGLVAVVLISEESAEGMHRGFPLT